MQGQSDEKEVSSPLKIVLDPVLSYVHAGLNSASVDATIKATLSYYPREAIDNAKDMLYKECCDGIAKPKRIDSELRKAVEADLHDIVAIMRKIDSNELPPTVFAVPSTKLGSLPRSRPEELLSISMADRICCLEEQFAQMKELTDGLILSKLDHGFRIRKLEECPKPSVSESAPMQQGAHWNPGGPPSSNHPNANALVQNQPQRPQQSKNSGAIPVASSQAKYSDIAAALSETDQEKWAMQKRKTRPRKRIVGKGNAGGDSGLKGAPEPSRFLFVSRVDKQCTTNEITTHLQANDVIARDIECVSHEKSVFKSYKLTVGVSQFKPLLNPDIWPEGVRVEPWRERSKRKDADDEETTAKKTVNQK